MHFISISEHMRVAYYLIIDLFPLDIRQTYLYNISVDVPKKSKFNANWDILNEHEIYHKFGYSELFWRDLGLYLNIERIVY